MKARITAVLLSVAATAAADPDRCARGVELAHEGDLPRAALYLEGCDDAVAAGVQEKLRASDLSSISIVTTPEGLEVETTALPGEKITAPATVWAKAGSYEVRVTKDGRVFAQTVKLAPHSRASVVIDVPAPKPVVVRDRAVTFDENAAEPQQSGPPPDQKHPSLMPCKFTTTGCSSAGEQLDDPLADRAAGPRDAATARWRAGLRVGGGIAHVGSLAMSLGVAGALRLSPRFAAIARIDWTRRESGMQGLDALAGSVGVATPLAMTDLAVVTVGLAARGELRFGDSFDDRAVRRAGLAGDATFDVVLRQMPIVLGARVSQGVTPLVANARETAVLLELGLELR